MCVSTAIRRLTALVLAWIRCADTLGTDVLQCVCQEEAEDAIDPIGIAVNKFGVLAYTCRTWEEAFSLTQKGITALAEERTLFCVSMAWYIQICFQLNIFGGSFRLLVSSCLLHSLEENRCS